MKLSPAVLDRAVGAVLASAAGDALGAPYEFGLPRPPARCALEGGGGFQWEPGEWTDDTQLALALLTPISEGHVDVGHRATAVVSRRMGDAGERVLVHCVSGENRSSDVAAAYLRTRGASAAAALDRVADVLGDRPKAFLADAVAAVQPR